MCLAHAIPSARSSMRRRFKSVSRKSLRLPRWIAVSATTALSLLATTAPVRGAMPVSLDDPRLDTSFRVMMGRVAADAVSAKPVPAAAGVKTLPATADGQLDMRSDIYLVLEGKVDRGAVERLGY